MSTNIMLRLILRPSYLLRRYSRFGYLLNKKQFSFKNTVINEDAASSQATTRHYSSRDLARKVNAYVTVVMSRLSPQDSSLRNGRHLTTLPIGTGKLNKKNIHFAPICFLETREKRYKVTSQLLNSERKSGKIVKVTVTPTISKIVKRIQERIKSQDIGFRNDVLPRKSKDKQQKNMPLESVEKGSLNSRNEDWPANLFTKYATPNSICSLKDPLYFEETNDELTVVQKMINEVSAKEMGSNDLTHMSLLNDSNSDNATRLGMYDEQVKQHRRKVTFEVLEKGDIKVWHLNYKNKILPYEVNEIPKSLIENSKHRLEDKDETPYDLKSTTNFGLENTKNHSKENYNIEDCVLKANMYEPTLNQKTLNDCHFSPVRQCYKRGNGFDQPNQVQMDPIPSTSGRTYNTTFESHSQKEMNDQDQIGVTGDIMCAGFQTDDMVEHSASVKNALANTHNITNISKISKPFLTKISNKDDFTHNETNEESPISSSKNYIDQNYTHLNYTVATKNVNDGIIKIPITKDNFPTNVEPVVDPHRSLIDVTTSIDRSTVIIQKDFYIAEKIKRKVKENKKPKPSSSDNKIEASSGSKETNDSIQNKVVKEVIVKKKLNYLGDVTKLYLNTQNNCKTTLGELISYSSKGLNPFNDKMYDVGHCNYDGSNRLIMSEKKSKSETSLSLLDGSDAEFKEYSTPKPHMSNFERQANNIGNLVDTTVSNLINYPKLAVNFTQHRFSHSPKNPPHSSDIDITTRTVITSVRTNNIANIEVQEQQRFVDKRLPIPFHTESIFQVYGRPDTLKEQINAVELTKARLEAVKLVDPGIKESFAAKETGTNQNLINKYPSKNKHTPYNVKMNKNLNEHYIPIIEYNNDRSDKHSRGLVFVKTKKSANSSKSIKSLGNIKKNINSNIKENQFTTNKHSQESIKRKSNSVYEHFDKIKLVNAKEFDKFMKDTGVKSGRHENATVSTNKNSEEKAESKFESSSVSNKPGSGAANKIKFIKQTHPTKKTRKRFVVQKRTKSTPIRTPNLNNKNYNSQRQIIDVKPIIKVAPKARSSEANFVDLTQDKAGNHSDKINVIDRKSVSNTENSELLTKRDETFIKHLLNDPKQKLNHVRELKDEAEIRKTKGVLPKKEFQNESDTNPNIVKRKTTLALDKNESPRKHSIQKGKKKIPNSIFPQKADQLKTIFKEASRDAPSYISVCHETMEKKVNTNKRRTPPCSKINTNLKHKSNTIYTKNKSHIKEGVPLVTNRKKISGFKEDIKPGRQPSKTVINQELEIDIDKLNKEISSKFNPKSYKRCYVPVEEITAFPLTNTEKQQGGFTMGKGVLCINFSTQPQLKESLASLPSVSRVLNSTMSDSSKAALNCWRINMISKLGEEGFNKFYQDQLVKGTEFHKTLEKRLSGKGTPTDNIHSSTKECLKSIDWVLTQLSDISVIQSQVVHSKLGYRGVLDCIAKFRNKPVLIEWKRSDKPKPLLQSTFDAPIQLSAYVGAFNYDPNYAFQIDGGIVAVAYSNGAAADVFHMTIDQCNQYWKLWLTRLQQFIMESSV